MVIFFCILEIIIFGFVVDICHLVHDVDRKVYFTFLNALVICNHGPPTPGAGLGIAVEMSGVFTFALSPQCGGNTRDLCYIGKKGGAMKT